MQGQALLQSGDTWFARRAYAEAAGAFGRVPMTPTSIYLDDAQYWLGRSDYAAGDLPGALAALQALVTSFPTSQYLDNALGYQARVYADQLQCASARAAYADLMTRFPTSTYVASTDAYLLGKGC